MGVGVLLSKGKEKDYFETDQRLRAREALEMEYIVLHKKALLLL